MGIVNILIWGLVNYLGIFNKNAFHLALEGLWCLPSRLASTVFSYKFRFSKSEPNVSSYMYRLVITALNRFIVLRQSFILTAKRMKMSINMFNHIFNLSQFFSARHLAGGWLGLQRYEKIMIIRFSIWLFEKMNFVIPSIYVKFPFVRF